MRSALAWHRPRQFHTGCPLGVWYVRAEATAGWVGRATPAGSAQEARTGQSPVAVSASSQGLYVLEGEPTFSYQGGRTNVLERLDPKTLAVVSSVAVPAFRRI